MVFLESLWQYSLQFQPSGFLLSTELCLDVTGTQGVDRNGVIRRPNQGESSYWNEYEHFKLFCCRISIVGVMNYQIIYVRYLHKLLTLFSLQCAWNGHRLEWKQVPEQNSALCKKENNSLAVEYQWHNGISLFLQKCLWFLWGFFILWNVPQIGHQVNAFPFFVFKIEVLLHVKVKVTTLSGS